MRRVSDQYATAAGQIVASGAVWCSAPVSRERKGGKIPDFLMINDFDPPCSSLSNENEYK